MAGGEGSTGMQAWSFTLPVRSMPFDMVTVGGAGAADTGAVARTLPTHQTHTAAERRAETEHFFRTKRTFWGLKTTWK